MINLKRYFIIGLVVSAIAFIIFSYNYENYFYNNTFSEIKNESKVIEHYIWEFDKESSLIYIKLAADYGKYKNVKIVETTGDVFIDVNFYKLKTLESICNKLGLMKLKLIKIPIYHNNKLLANMYVTHYKDTIQTYFLYLIINIFMLIIYLFIVYLLKVKNSLTFLVENRTNELEERQKMLIEANDKLAVTINSIGDIFISTNINGIIDYINPIGEEILKYTLKELKGRSFEEVFYFFLADNDKKQKYFLSDVLKNGLTVSHEEPILFEDKKGKLIHVLDKSTPIYNSHNEIIGSVIILKDITKTYQLLEELRQAQKMESIGQLSGGIAHDFNNMLSGILGATEILLLEDNIPQIYKENLEIILKSSQKASQLTRKLLDFSRKGGVYKEILNVENEISETVELLKRSIDKKIKIITKFNAKNKFIKIDSSQFQNAIINIILNSKDAMTKNPKIKIELSNFYADKDFCKKSLFNIKEQEYIKISIEDNGKGMPSEIKERIFEPFFTTKDVGKGTGLGLSAVYGTVIDYGGFIDVESELATRTEVSLYFPIIKGEEVNNKLKLKTDQEFNFNGGVLIVDDEDGVRKISIQMLKKIGFNVYDAENGKDAIKVYEENRKDIRLVIMDIVMPEMDGREAFYKLKDINKDINVILLSGFTREASINMLIKDGVKGFLSKPYTIQALKDKIKEVLL
jgi:PAS domain S-box-containing protein